MNKLIILFAIIFFASCQSKALQEEKKRQEANEFFAINKPELAELCKKEFPNLITQYIKGEPIITIEKEYIEGETIECPEPTKETPKPSVKCPPCESKTKTIYKTDTIKITDTRDLYLKESENQSLKKSNESLFSDNQRLISELNKENKQKIKFMWLFGSLLGLVLIYFAFKIYKKLYLK